MKKSNDAFKISDLDDILANGISRDEFNDNLSSLDNLVKNNEENDVKEFNDVDVFLNIEEKEITNYENAINILK